MFRRGDSLPMRDSSKSSDSPRSFSGVAYKGGESSGLATSTHMPETRRFQSFGRAVSIAKKSSNAFNGRSISQGSYSNLQMPLVVPQGSYSNRNRSFEAQRQVLAKNLESDNSLDALKREEFVVNMTNLPHIPQQQLTPIETQYQFDSLLNQPQLSNNPFGDGFEEISNFLRMSANPENFVYYINMQNSVFLNDEEVQQNYFSSSSTANSSSSVSTCFQKPAATPQIKGGSGSFSTENFQSTKLAAQNVNLNAKKTLSQPLNPYAKEWKPAAMKTDGVVSDKINFFERDNASHGDSSFTSATCTDFSNIQQIFRRDVQFQPNYRPPGHCDQSAISGSNAYHKLEYFTSPFFFNSNDPRPTVLKTFEMSKGYQNSYKSVPFSSPQQQSSPPISPKSSELLIASKLNETQQKLKNYFGFGSVDKRLFQWSLQNSNSDELLQKFQQQEREQNVEIPPKNSLMIARSPQNKLQRSDSFEIRDYLNKSQEPLLEMDQLAGSPWAQPFQFQQTQSRTLINDLSFAEPCDYWKVPFKGMEYFQKYGKEILGALNQVNEANFCTLSCSSTCHSEESAQSFYGLADSASMEHIADLSISASLKEYASNLHDSENAPSTECLPKVQENVAFFESFARKNSFNVTSVHLQTKRDEGRRDSTNFLVKKFRQIFEVDSKSVNSGEAAPHTNNCKELVLHFNNPFKKNENYVSMTLQPSSEMSSSEYNPSKTLDKTMATETLGKLTDSDLSVHSLHRISKRRDRKPHNRIMRSYRRHRFRDEKTQELESKKHSIVETLDSHRVRKGFYAGGPAKRRKLNPSPGRTSPTEDLDATFSSVNHKLIECRMTFEPTLLTKDVDTSKLTQKLRKNGGFSYIFPNAEVLDGQYIDCTENQDDIQIDLNQETLLTLDRFRKSNYESEVQMEPPQPSDREPETCSKNHYEAEQDMTLEADSSESSSSFSSTNTCSVITMIAVNQFKQSEEKLKKDQENKQIKEMDSVAHLKRFQAPNLLKTTRSDELVSSVLTIYSPNKQRKLSEIQEEVKPTMSTREFLECLHDLQINFGMICRPSLTYVYEETAYQSAFKIYRRMPKLRPSTERSFLDKRHIFLLRFQHPYFSQYACDLNIFYFVPEVFNWPTEDMICRQLLRTSLIAFSFRVNVMTMLYDVYDTFKVELFHVMKGARRTQRFNFIDNYILSSLKNAFRLRKIQYRKKLLKQQACEAPKKLHLTYCSSKSPMDISWTYNGRLQLAQFVLMKICDEIEVLGAELSSPTPHPSDSTIMAMPLLDVMSKHNLLAFMKLLVLDILANVVDLCKKERFILIDTILSEAGDGDAGLRGESEA